MKIKVVKKADACFLVSEVCQEDLEMLRKARAITSENNKPTHVVDIYKMRRGRWKGIRIWQNINLGNGVERDLFVTRQNYELVTIDTYETFALVKEKINV